MPVTVTGKSRDEVRSLVRVSLKCFVPDGRKDMRSVKNPFQVLFWKRWRRGIETEPYDSSFTCENDH